jgi:hypothetical protein
MRGVVVERRLDCDQDVTHCKETVAQAARDALACGQRADQGGTQGETDQGENCKKEKAEVK